MYDSIFNLSDEGETKIKSSSAPVIAAILQKINVFYNTYGYVIKGMV